MTENITSKATEVVRWSAQSGVQSFQDIMNHVNATWPQLKPRLRADIISKAWAQIKKKGTIT